MKEVNTYRGYVITHENGKYTVFKPGKGDERPYWINKYGRRLYDMIPTFGYIVDAKGAVDSFIEHMEKVNKLLNEWAVKAPREAHIVIRVPKNLSDEAGIRDYLLKEYHLDMGIDPENEDEYEKLYYNEDLRSFSGFLWDDEGYNYTASGLLELVMLPRYYATDKDYNVLEPGCTYGDEWRKMLSRVDDIISTDP